MGVLAWAVIIVWCGSFGLFYWLLGSRGWQLYYGFMLSLVVYFSVFSGSSVLTGMVMGWMALPVGVGAAGGVFG